MYTQPYNRLGYLRRIHYGYGTDGRYEMDVERRIVAGNRVNGALAAQHSCSVTWILQKKNEIKMNAVKM